MVIFYGDFLSDFFEALAMVKPEGCHGMNCGMKLLPSGELTVCNGKWPSRNSGFTQLIAWWIFP